jgi:tripartite-type tricarboxylate transporter receptor subunit TctC
MRMAAILALALLSLTVGRDPAAAADALIAGKTIRLLVGSPVGGGTDRTARLVAHYLAPLLPGEPVLIVQNMPGGGGILALNSLAGRSAADGLTLLLGSSSALTPDLVRDNPAVHYDPRQLAFIGGFAADSAVLVADRAAFARMQAGGPPLVVAQVGAARTAAQMALWGAATLGWRIRWISGYAGSADLATALLRGEADMTDTAGRANLQPLLADHRFLALAQSGVMANGRLKPGNGLEAIPLFSDLLAGKLDGPAAPIFARWLATTQIGKFLVLPPATPAPIVAIYRDAFRAMTANPYFQDLAATEIDPDYAVMRPADLARIAAELGAMPESDVAFMRQLKQRYGLPAARR